MQESEAPRMNFKVGDKVEYVFSPGVVFTVDTVHTFNLKITTPGANGKTVVVIAMKAQCKKLES